MCNGCLAIRSLLVQAFVPVPPEWRSWPDPSCAGIPSLCLLVSLPRNPVCSELLGTDIRQLNGSPTARNYGCVCAWCNRLIPQQPLLYVCMYVCMYVCLSVNAETRRCHRASDHVRHTASIPSTYESTRWWSRSTQPRIQVDKRGQRVLCRHPPGTRCHQEQPPATHCRLEELLDQVTHSIGLTDWPFLPPGGRSFHNLQAHGQCKLKTAFPSCSCSLFLDQSLPSPVHSPGSLCRICASLRDSKSFET
jgi:hypothetical protein